MKKFIYKFPILLILLAVIVSCEEERVIYDVENGQSFATFQGSPSPLVFNPVEDTENVFTISVSTKSSMDRAVSISVDSASTLDPSFYEIQNPNPVIPAGEFSVDVVIVTPATETFPATGSNLILNLDSVEGAELGDFNTTSFDIGFTVACPTVDLSSIPGTYDITALTFFNFFEETETVKEIVAGPGENQFTIIDGPYPVEGSEDLIFTVNPQNGSITAIDETKIASEVSFGPNTYSFLSGGRVLTCIGVVEIRFDFGGNIAGNPNTFNLVKQ